jgi:hypothetical protein
MKQICSRALKTSSHATAGSVKFVTGVVIVVVVVIVIGYAPHSLSLRASD